jgi:hypothetical protein
MEYEEYGEIWVGIAWRFGRSMKGVSSAFALSCLSVFQRSLVLAFYTEKGREHVYDI